MKLFRILLLILPLISIAQNGLFEHTKKHTRQDSLRGSITPERAWWNVTHYDLSVEVFPKTKTLKGKNRISFEVLQDAKKMQLDLQEPMRITNIVHHNNLINQPLPFKREGNVYWVNFPNSLQKTTHHKISVYFEGTPTESKNPPWSGGITWKKDTNGIDFIASSNQGIGASVWWPNKDHDYDEPDNGALISVTVPEQLTNVSNGRLINTIHLKEEGKKIFQWEVKNPINNYGININIGNYVHFSETYKGEKGLLDCSYWVLKDNLEKAKTQFKQAKMTLEAFEYWFGPYPFYEDSYKLVEAPYLGMEHQSSVTYGNGYQNGYRGTDLSGTGVGLKFDFIIVHESGHEWFANNITNKDVADMWIHESFTAYSESLFIDYHFSTKEAEDYVIGTRAAILNDKPIIGIYNVNQEGSSDMYYKGANMLHTLRQIINNDTLWRAILRGLNNQFYHQQVSSKQIENYISTHAKINLKGFFDQYLRTVKIPVLEVKTKKKKLCYKFTNTVNNFAIPVKVWINNKPVWLNATNKTNSLKLNETIKSFNVDRNFYVSSKKQ